ncbi:hypothetical protein MP638_000914 [Amoeboaphelidium occidentale]|nr:hypothetical protein MP638_000914 [Amoeboaphelidium occidentale]
MKKYLTPVGSVSNTPIESSPSSVDISDIGLPCIVLDVQRRSEEPQPGESPPITIALITGFDGKPLNEVMAKEEFNRIVPIHPTPIQEGITISSPIHTTPEWLPHPMCKTPSYVLCIPIKVFPQNLCAFQDIIQLDADNLLKLNLHILFLGNVIANAEYEDSEFEDSDDDGEIQLGEWKRKVNWDEVTV